MAQGLGRMGSGMGGEGMSDEELLGMLAGELDEIMKALRAGKYMTRESGKGASSWGYGTSNLKSDSTPGTSEGERSERDVEGAGFERSEINFDPIYAPEQVPSQTYDTRVRGRIGEGGTTLMQEFRSLPTSAEGLSDYYDIVSAYTGAEERAIDAEDIPPEFRDLVRDYFSGLNDPKDGMIPSIDVEEESDDETDLPLSEDGSRLEVLTEEGHDTT